MHPNAKSFRAAARNSLKGYWGWALLVCLVGAILGGTNTPSVFTYTFNRPEYYSSDVWNAVNYAFHSATFGLMMVWCIAALIVGSVVELGVCAFHTRLNLGQRPPFSSLFERFDIFLKALGLRLFMMLFVILWSLLFVVPGIIAVYRYSMAPYLMAEYPDMGIREAVNRSKELMDGNKGRLFCLDFSFIGWWLLSALTFGILGLWIAPYALTARAAFYLELTGKPFGLSNQP